LPCLIAFFLDGASLLAGFQVYSVCWYPVENDRQPLVLLTASMDKCILLWEPVGDDRVWEPSSRVGELGGNTLGFYGSVFGACGNTIVAHGSNGAWYAWQRVPPRQTPATLSNQTGVSDTRVKWHAVGTMSGHPLPVTDVSWCRSSGALLTCGQDQTTRCFARARPETAALAQRRWCELSRPQVHGHDMVCVTSVSATCFVSGAEEKVLRVFEATQHTVETVNRLAGVELISSAAVLSGPSFETRPLGASVPALGLSNKAVFSEDVQRRGGAHGGEVDPFMEENPASYSFNPVHLSAPPPETELVQNTLWPEVLKLYGHGMPGSLTMMFSH
jgi:elongator complex protein 2